MSKGGRIALAIVIGLIAALFGTMYLNSKREELLGSTEAVRVYVASQDVPANTALNPDMISVREMPRTFVQPQAVLVADVPDKARLTGVTIVTIKENEQILRTKLYEGAPPPLAADLASRQGLVAVGVSMSNKPHSLNGLVRAGDRVDVLASFQFEKSQNEDFTEIRPLLQNIEVLAVDSRTASNRAVATGRPGEEAPEVDARTVTLAVAPAAAQQLILAQQLGNVWLLLRATGDTASKQYEVWNNDRLLQSPHRLWRAEDPRTEMLRQIQRNAR